MSSTPRKSAELFVEPLEARIAPTGLVAITNPLSNTDPNSSVGKGDPRYIDYTVAPSPGKLGFVPGANFGVPGADIYAITLTGDANSGLNGDLLSIYNPVVGFNLTNPFIQSTNGTVIAFFQDANHDGLVQNTELVGISMSKGAIVNVNGTVHGDIVDNINSSGVLNLAGALKTKQSIGGITVVGDVTGSVLAGGAINNVSISGHVESILTGTAASGADLHLGDVGTVTATLNVPLPKLGVAGPSIVNVSVASVGNVIKAGDGGIYGDGGSVLNTTIQNDVDGFSILSGNGGDGNILGKAGSGGTVGDLVVKGVIDSTNGGAGVQGLISIGAGHGGTNADLKGGKGGPIDGVAISYDTLDTSSGTGQMSVDILNDRVIIHAGDGGIGQRGGNGGSVSDALVATDTASDGNPNVPEMQIFSGTGGVSTIADTGHGGRGGDMNLIVAENFLVPGAVTPGSILVQAGDGITGKDGGSVNAVTLLGTHLTVNGGNGTDGFNHGGSGGSVNTVNILNLFDLFATDVAINGGAGGAGFNGNGGNGGDVIAVRMVDSHLNSLTINSGNHANGGASTGGVGGAGGSVSDIIMSDSGDFRATAAQVAVRSGNGGDGTYGGGNGGSIGGGTSTVQIIGTDLAYAVTSGSGGSVTGGDTGDAGIGGSITGVGLANQPVAVTSIVDQVTGLRTTQTQISSGNTSTVISGTGGTAADGLGGAGGDITDVDVVTSVNITPVPNLNQLPAGFVADSESITSGAGGSGGSGAAKGGDIANSGAVSAFGAVTVIAGNAGTDGGATAVGGAIDHFVAAALGQITLKSGNGGAGGAGGDISNTVTNLAPVSASLADPTVRMTNNRGGLTVRAGDGSVGNGAGGAGGSVSVFSGYVSSGGLTSITAGAGGGVDNVKLTGAGGSVQQVTLTGVNDPNNFNTGSTVTIDAGNAGVSAKSKHGSDGGTASNITIFNVDAGTVIQHIAAGDGGMGKLTGGNGGSVSDVHVGLPTEAVDIGYRDTRNFGYDVATGAGGIFAGLGGQSAGGVGASGDVTDITAAAIASIVAGKSGVRLAGTVDMIYLSGQVTATANANGAFTNFDQANIVGSVPNPGAVGASTFQINVDGVIAAINLTNNRDFQPEATLTLVNNQLVVADIQEPNLNPVIISL